MTTRYTTTAQDQPEATSIELVDYLLSGNAPVNATAGQVRAIARLFQFAPVMKALADGAEVDAQELGNVATAELAQADADTIGTLALQSLVNWLIVGTAQVRVFEEVRSI